jgi:leukotriene-A4 hydrolase
VSKILSEIQYEAVVWQQNQLPLTEINTEDWITQEWVIFLRSLPVSLSSQEMRELDEAFHLTDSRNAEILQHWLLMAVRSHCEDGYPRLRSFLCSVGRRIYIKPLCQELAKTEAGTEIAASSLRRSPKRLPPDLTSHDRSNHRRTR